MPQAIDYAAMAEQVRQQYKQANQPPPPPRSTGAPAVPAAATGILNPNTVDLGPAAEVRRRLGGAFNKGFGPLLESVDAAYNPFNIPDVLRYLRQRVTSGSLVPGGGSNNPDAAWGAWNDPTFDVEKENALAQQQGSLLGDYAGAIYQRGEQIHDANRRGDILGAKGQELGLLHDVFGGAAMHKALGLSRALSRRGGGRAINIALRPGDISDDFKTNVGQTFMDEPGITRGQLKSYGRGTEQDLQARVQAVPESITYPLDDIADATGQATARKLMASHLGPWKSDTRAAIEALVTKHKNDPDFRPMVSERPDGYLEFDHTPPGLTADDALQSKRAFAGKSRWGKDDRSKTTATTVDENYAQQGSMENKNALEDILTRADDPEAIALLELEQKRLAQDAALKQADYRYSSWGPHIVAHPLAGLLVGGGASTMGASLPVALTAALLGGMMAEPRVMTATAKTLHGANRLATSSPVTQALLMGSTGRRGQDYLRPMASH